MGRLNAFAPLLTSEVQATFERESSLRLHQQRSLDVRLDFFRLERENHVSTAQPLDPSACLVESGWP
ncbi:hypothetical protein [Halomonas sp. Alg239-R46]|uniref:Uncharacterized protein n=1 Tax=Vreelandella sp. SM1641 TaxID=3126101 RepID=A0AAU7XSR1_9GAMM|nr:hypothetical protein [Halomonas sp. Alg239-R46]